jgi:glucan 1,3-beta-glucosidase
MGARRQVAQAASITNVWFKLGRGSNNQGMWMENGSALFFSDLIFDGGKFGLWVGNQQLTTRNITIRDASVAAIYLNWDWVWTFINLRVERSPVAISVAGGTGSLVVLDSTFIGCATAIQTQFNPSTGFANNSVIVDNVNYSAFPT